MSTEFTYVTTENTEQIPGSIPGEAWFRTSDSDEWANLGDFSEFRSPSQGIIYDRKRNKWLKVVTGPHCTTCTCNNS